MRNKYTVALIACALVFNAFGAVFTVAQTNQTVQTNSPTAALAALLPASDGIVTIDMRKVINEAVPQILSGKPQTLTAINAKLDSFREQTGFDLKQFEQVAVGVSMKQLAAKEIDLEPVVLARGKYNAGALVALAKLASKGKYREEKIGARTIYIFSRSDVAPNKPAATGSSKDQWLDRAIDRMIDGLTKEIAVTAYDNNTLAVGVTARVRETLNAKTRVNADLLGAVSRKPNAVAAFSANLPTGLSKFIDLDNDEFGMTLDSIRQATGSMELINGDTAVSVTAKTLKTEQAQQLLEMLQGLQMIGKTLLGGSKSADKQVYTRMIENSKISLNQSEVSLDLQVPQADINILLGVK